MRVRGPLPVVEVFADMVTRLTVIRLQSTASGYQGLGADEVESNTELARRDANQAWLAYP